MDGNEVIGVCSWSESRLQNLRGWAEINSIYLLHEYAHKGYGRALLQEGLHQIAAAGYHNVFLWVLEQNSRACRFYASLGFISANVRKEKGIGSRQVVLERWVLHLEKE